MIQRRKEMQLKRDTPIKKESIKQYKRGKYLENRTSKITYHKAKYQENHDMQLAYQKCR